MIRIFNKNTNAGILLDDSLGRIIVTPKDYDEDDPHILIELQGVHFLKHAIDCNNCNSFIKSLGTKTTDWHISYLDKTKRLDLSRSESKNVRSNVKFNISEWFVGTKLRLKIDNDSIESLTEKLTEEEESENYESCHYILEKLNNIRNK